MDIEKILTEAIRLGGQDILTEATKTGVGVRLFQNRGGSGNNWVCEIQLKDEQDTITLKDMIKKIDEKNRAEVNSEILKFIFEVKKYKVGSTSKNIADDLVEYLKCKIGIKPGYVKRPGNLAAMTPTLTAMRREIQSQNYNSYIIINSQFTAEKITDKKGPVYLYKLHK